MRKEELMSTSSEVKHTRGPWIVTDDADDLLGAVIGVCDKNEEDGAVAYAYKICGNRTTEEARANARLISAAPELLAALKACHLQMLQSNNNSEYAIEANEMAKAAIAKAEGKG